MLIGDGQEEAKFKFLFSMWCLSSYWKNKEEQSTYSNVFVLRFFFSEVGTGSHYTARVTLNL